MIVTYRVITIAEAKATNAPDADDFYDDEYDDPRQGLWRFEDDQPVELLGSDGGEPEDNSFNRDWSWVGPALQAAYNLGVQHAAS